MATVPVTRTSVAGEVVTAAHFNNNIRDVLAYLLAPPSLELRQTSAQTLTTGVAAALTYTTEDVDSSGMHSNVSNTSRATSVYPGWYRGSGGMYYANNATGVRACQWRVNGTDISGSASGTVAFGGGNDTNVVFRTKLFFLNVNDFLEQVAFQNSGGNLNTVASGVSQANFTAVWESN